ncbi:hypothetical protein M4I21_00080 [Cellulophaga sp. 20_2_10]|uniref:hypothetical protein n=1 Tax=Cellulophaga sp. 20_2_10 TaxID=2942476 RepID=UPI00201B0341|nr:hypothetical protein [Cellulophaga sp. 20_2_10]MCL5244185.1 hypothetical protein [Cellulophaga sp. 20_2_10]
MIDILRLMFEFSAVIVFCLLQFIIYPSLTYYSREELLKWYHTGRDRIFLFALILAPGHLITSVLQLIDRQNSYTIISILVILFMWIQHITIIEPKHGKIIAGLDSSESIKKFISKQNLIRIILVSFLLGWTIYNTSKSTTMWLGNN